MKLEHTQIKSRQCQGLSDPEGTQPNIPTDDSPSAKYTFAGEVSRGSQFDEPGPNVEKQGPMEEAHSSRTR